METYTLRLIIADRDDPQVITFEAQDEYTATVEAEKLTLEHGITTVSALYAPDGCQIARFQE